MDFIAYRDRDFKESFDFKNEQGQAITLPAGDFRVVLTRGSYAREYTVENNGLNRQRTQLFWIITDTSSFAYNTMYYTLYLNDTELSRGIVRVQ